MMDLYGVKTLIEEVEEAIENKEVKTLNRQQEKYLKDHYNTLVKFNYFEDDMGNYVVSMTKGAYKSFRYYLVFHSHNHILLLHHFHPVTAVVYNHPHIPFLNNI